MRGIAENNPPRTTDAVPCTSSLKQFVVVPCCSRRGKAVKLLKSITNTSKIVFFTNARHEYKAAQGRTCMRTCSPYLFLHALMNSDNNS